MRIHPVLRPARLLVLAALLGAAAGGSQAQALPPGVRLGMTGEELLAVLPGLERVQRPQRLAGGVAGLWRGAPAPIGGLVFEPVYYLAGGQLRRVEWASAALPAPDLAAAAFADLVAWGRGQFGPELASNDPGSHYAAWVQGDVDVYAQRLDNARGASVRLVYKGRQLKDASEL